MATRPGAAARFRRRVDGEIQGRARDAHELRERCAPAAALRKLRCAPEDPEKLRALADGRRIPANARLVYGLIRQAIRSGFDGAEVSGAELGELAGCSTRTAWYAIRRLEELGLVRRVQQYRDVEPYVCPSTHRTYERRQERNCYVLGERAPRVHRRSVSVDEKRAMRLRFKGKNCTPTLPPSGRKGPALPARCVGQSFSPGHRPERVQVDASGGEPNLAASPPGSQEHAARGNPVAMWLAQCPELALSLGVKGPASPG